MLTQDQVMDALSKVLDPEIRRPLTELKMIDFVEIESFSVKVGVLLTVSGCPMRTEISDSVKSAILKLDEHLNISIEFSVMSDYT